MVQAVRVATALLGLTVALAGCGGSSKHASTSADRARYAAAANAVCADAQSRTAPLIKKITAAEPGLVTGIGGSAQRIAPTVAQLHTVAAGSLAKLQAIQQPAGDHAAIARFMDPLSRVVAEIGQAAGLLAQGQSAQAFALIQQAQPDAQQVKTAAQAYGLGQCKSVVSILG